MFLLQRGIRNFKTRNFNVKVSAGEGKAFIGLVDMYTENKPVHSLIAEM